MAARSSSPANSMDPIAFDQLSELQQVYTRISANLQHHVTAVLSSIIPGSDEDTPEFRESVTKLVTEQFQNDLHRVVQANISLNGRSYGEHLAQKSTETEPFNEQLNRTVLTYQIKVHDVVCDNCNKRKEGPKKALTQIETASTHFKNAREKELQVLASERERIRFDPSKVCNCVIPDRDTVAAQWGETLTAIDKLATSLPSMPAQIEEPIQVQEDIAKLRQPSA